MQCFGKRGTVPLDDESILAMCLNQNRTTFHAIDELHHYKIDHIEEDTTYPSIK